MSGPILADDLMFSPCEGIWRRADDPEWQFPAPEDAELAFCVVRKAAYRPAPEQSVRTYTIRREAVAGEQVRLF